MPHKDFPLSEQKGSASQHINTILMQEMAERSEPVQADKLAQILEKHNEFLSDGYGGGSWQTVLVGGLVLGIYTQKYDEKNRQADFSRKHIPADLDLREIVLPYSNFCGVFMKNQDLSEANLEGCLFTDALLSHTIFAEANLEGCDFSRANLVGANFMNANLRGTDFENCDLTGADFRGADLTDARFPGAILDKIFR
jgi:uncharacterized protein YjbI with pentapeptide repeats